MTYAIALYAALAAINLACMQPFNYFVAGFCTALAFATLYPQ